MYESIRFNNNRNINFFFFFFYIHRCKVWIDFIPIFKPTYYGVCRGLCRIMFYKRKINIVRDFCRYFSQLFRYSFSFSKTSNGENVDRLYEKDRFKWSPSQNRRQAGWVISCRLPIYLLIPKYFVVGYFFSFLWIDFNTSVWTDPKDRFAFDGRPSSRTGPDRRRKFRGVW